MGEILFNQSECGVTWTRALNFAICLNAKEKLLWKEEKRGNHLKKRFIDLVHINTPCLIKYTRH